MKSLFDGIKHRIRAVFRSELQLQLADLQSQVSALEDSLKSLMARLVEVPLVTAGNVSKALKTELSHLHPSSKKPEENPVSYEQSLECLRELNPALFPVWESLFEAGAKSYVEKRLGSCSHRDHHYAKLFGAYVALFAKGTILDVGCGPHGLPVYLGSVDTKNLYGLEPLPMEAVPNFPVRRGFNEFLPWTDGQFDTVVSGTSLDHVLSLEKSLQEVRRVLRPDGRYLVWIASIPGALEFDEKATDFKPIDAYHLFHFDRIWIEPRFEKYFDIADVCIVNQPGFDHVFYALKPRTS